MVAAICDALFFDTPNIPMKDAAAPDARRVHHSVVKAPALERVFASGASGAFGICWGPSYRAADLVVTWEDGRLLHPNIISRTFVRLTEGAGPLVIRLHDLRHSYASPALEAGIGLKVVSKRLGHSSIPITGDIYSHVRAEVDQSAADQVAGLILGGAG
jgi:integrase